ncbi:hypothetical protein ACQP2E_19150 [Actinoplanes sp. CA-015351]|uniref:hypothetical protein n=1 Tax=Actinoplanes sp. CA-015351 TaxID=3239897 RepID=UPI003D989328
MLCVRGGRGPADETWVDRVHEGLAVTGRNYPFIAAAFWGPWRDPVRNIWVIEWGMLCCLAIMPLLVIRRLIHQLAGIHPTEQART